MYNGFFAAASGMETRSKALEVMGNNIANINTAGYKKDCLISTTFGDHLEYEEGRALGNATFGNKTDITYTSFDQGSVRETGRPFDFYLKGDGFFNILTADGNTTLTRNGQFSLDENGYLVDYRGNMVLCQNGPVMIGSSDFTVNENGQIFRDNNYLDTLTITCPADLNSLVKVGEGYYTNVTGNEPFAGSVIQGSKESSNIDMVKEMSDMMAASRGFQTCAQIVKMYDKIMQRSANEVGRL